MAAFGRVGGDERRPAQAKLMKGGGFYEEERQRRKEVLKQGGGGNLAVLSLAFTGERDVRRNYTGYLKPWLPVIEDMNALGHKPWDIARELFRLGARSPYNVPEGDRRWGWEQDMTSSFAGLIRGIVNPKPPKPRRTIHQRRNYWHVWTPERQRAEFDAEF